jgi:hypothetical protein
VSYCTSQHFPKRVQGDGPQTKEMPLTGHLFFNLMRKQILLLLTVLIVASCVLAAPRKAPAKKPLPVWKPAPALLKHLAPQTELPFGTIRLPRGYEISEGVGAFDTAGSGYAWNKKAARGREDHVVGILQFPLEATGQEKVTLESSFNDLVKGTSRLYHHYRYAKPQRGIVNGRTVLKSNWSGTYRRDGLKVQGMVLVIVDATDTYAVFTRHRSDQAAEKRLTEAAIYTLKIQSEVNTDSREYPPPGSEDRRQNTGNRKQGGKRALVARFNLQERHPGVRE